MMLNKVRRKDIEIYKEDIKLKPAVFIDAIMKRMKIRFMHYLWLEIVRYHDMVVIERNKYLKYKKSP